MSDHPFPGLDERGLRRLILAGFVVFLVSGATMMLLESALTDRGAGIVELELADRAGSEAILDDWGSRGCDSAGFDCQVRDVTWRAKAIVLVDFAFLAAYGIGGAAILAALADRRRDRRPWVPRGLAHLAWVMLAAAVSDAAENAALWQVLVLNTRGFAEVATAFAVVKFGLVAFTLVAGATLLIAGREPRHDDPVAQSLGRGSAS